MKKTIVISAVNLIEGGTFTILCNCLKSLVADRIDQEYRIVVLVNNASVFDYPTLEFIEYPKAKKSWINRIYYEYFGFNKLSRTLKPHLWLSLHDTTPAVKADIRAVYCHNSTPFMKLNCSDWRFNYKIVLFALFYKYLYKINIQHNDFVIVQQQWLKEAFVDMYNLDQSKVIVAYANAAQNNSDTPQTIQETSTQTIKDPSKKVLFFYPSLARQFKNFEVICEAVKILNQAQIKGFEVILTLDGSENNYSKWLLSKYKNVENIRFVGLIPHNKMDDYYAQTDCLIFPSKLETWGLPISEFGKYNKPMLLADLPYSYETSNSAQKVCHFPPSDAKDLANKMGKFITGDITIFKPQKKILITPPFTKGFGEMFKILLK